jgi:Phosphotransferase enzyme family
MSLRRIDVRFVLPRAPREAVVLGLEDWHAALRNNGDDLRMDGLQPDLAVAPVDRAQEAVSTGAEAVILEGRGGVQTLRRAGFVTRAYLPLPGLAEPDLLLPLGPGSPARYALARWRPATTALKRTRNALAARLAERGTVPGRPHQVVGTRERGPPFLIAAAAAVGIPPDVGWFLTLGQGDDLTRAVFHLFPPCEERPSWVLKFARVPGYEEPFARDEAALALAASGGPTVTAHAPSLLGRFEAASHHASVETAAVGERLSTMLARSRSDARAAIDEIAAWIVDVAEKTAAPSHMLAAERARVGKEVLPAWSADPRLVTELPELPAVLQHNDLGSWNVVWDAPGRFTAVDWESARRHGFPLWDLLYFLVDVLPQLDGARSIEARVDGALQLLRGQTRWSTTLFAWIRKAVERASLPPETVGRLATLAWLHHGLSHNARAEAVARAAGGTGVEIPPIERIAPVWLSDPMLGVDWDRWRE